MNKLKFEIIEIEELLNRYDSSPTECDGMTMLCHTVLHNVGVSHQVIAGICEYQDRIMPIHYWIELLDDHLGWVVDYRLQMWFGKSDNVPHEIFQPENYAQIEYIGIPDDSPPLSQAVFHILQQRMPLHDFLKTESALY